MRFKSRDFAVAIGISLGAHSLNAHSQGFLGGLFGGKDTGQEESAEKVLQDAKVFASAFQPWARPFMYSLYRDGEWGAVLNFNRLGLAAMEQKRPDIARRSFDEAIARVEAIYADDENAKRARSVFNAEKVKDFKGEPYERSMLYYYRGLLYLQEGDYQNARAAFLAADRHDTLSSAEDAAYVGTFGLMKYLAGWASSCEGDKVRAQQLAEEARAADPAIASLPPNPSSSLVLLDTGPAPVKWGAGAYNHILKFRAGDGHDGQYWIVTSAGSEITSFNLVGDIALRATTRGGREVDGILQGKAQFKGTAGTVGNTAMNAGSQVAMLGTLVGDRNAANAGLAGMFIGLIAKGIEASTNPAADTRSWDSLPSHVMLHSAPGVAAGPVQIVVNGEIKQAAISASNGDCSFAWGRTRSALASESGGSAMINSDPPREESRGARNKAMRLTLTTDLAVVAK